MPILFINSEASHSRHEVPFTNCPEILPEPFSERIRLR